MKRKRARSQPRTAEFARVDRAAKYIAARTRLSPRVAVVLGSGLGGFAERLAKAKRVQYAVIPGFPCPDVAGHAGCLVLGTLDGVPVGVMQGRAHLYEGYSAREVAFPIRVLWRLGVRSVILTNAAGGVHPRLQAGALVLIRDHINLQGENPLTGANDERFGPRFPDMTGAYDKTYRAIALTEAQRLGIELQEGVYAGLRGPSYETPAEIRFLATIGADLVGMSTVAETIAARHLGLRVLAISCVANSAVDVQEQGINHAQVVAASQRAEERLTALLRAVIPRITAEKQ